jgi:hypothetical protein
MQSVPEEVKDVLSWSRRFCTSEDIIADQAIAIIYNSDYILRSRWVVGFALVEPANQFCGMRWRKKNCVESNPTSIVSAKPREMRAEAYLPYICAGFDLGSYNIPLPDILCTQKHAGQNTAP